MALETQIEDLATRVATEFNTVRTEIAGAPGTGAILLEVNQTVPPPDTPIGTIVYRKVE